MQTAQAHMLRPPSLPPDNRASEDTKWGWACLGRGGGGGSHICYQNHSLSEGARWGNEWVFCDRGIMMSSLRNKCLLCWQARCGCQKSWILNPELLIFKSFLLFPLLFFTYTISTCTKYSGESFLWWQPQVCRHHRQLWKKFFLLFLTPRQGSVPMFWLICNSKHIPFPFRVVCAPPPHWFVSHWTQGLCLTEPWMLFRCHTFPKRLAAAPIVAAGGGLLGWSFRPPAVAPLSHEGAWLQQWQIRITSGLE